MKKLNNDPIPAIKCPICNCVVDPSGSYEVYRYSEYFIYQHTCSTGFTKEDLDKMELDE